ncbi:MAG: PKD domain-containing protein, partial [Ferruginibacter sp.]
ANAGFDRTIILPVNMILLNGSGTDNDGSIVSYSWIKVSGPLSGNITGANTPNPTAYFIEVGVYEFRLTVTDNAGASATDIVQITVLPAPNMPPLVNAGFDVNIYLPDNSVQLTAVATDSDGTITGYNWRVINGPSQYNFANINNVQTLFNNLQQGIYKVEIRVTDNNGATASDTVVVTVGSSRLTPSIENKLNVFPNPVQDQLNVEISSSREKAKVKMRLFDNKGILVMQKELIVISNVLIERIAVSRLAAGMYIMHLIFDDNSKISKQIIKL